MPLHAHCLFKLGVYLGEIWLLSDLADWLCAHGRSRLPPGPRRRCAFPGAVGSPANAVATVESEVSHNRGLEGENVPIAYR